MKKKILVITVMAVVAMGAVLALVSNGDDKDADPAQEFEVDGIIYAIKSSKDKTVDIVGHGDFSPHLVIPETVEFQGLKYTVKSISKESFIHCTTIESLTVSDSVRDIAEKAFDGCSSLKSVVLGKNTTTLKFCAFADCINLSNLQLTSVEIIGESAFEKCSSIKSLILPETVVKVFKYSFLNCTNIESLTAPVTLNDGYDGGFFPSFKNCCNIKTLTLTKGTDGKDPTFKKAPGNRNCPWNDSRDVLTTIIVSEGVVELGQQLFKYCTALENLILPSTLKRIGTKAFMYCDSLEKLILPDSLEELGKLTFSFCENLKEISVPAHLDTVVMAEGSPAFSECHNIEKVTLTKGNGNVKDYDGNGSTPWRHSKDRFQTLIVAEGVTSIGDETFAGCDKLANVTFPSTLKSIGHQAFKDCKSLETLILPDSVEKMDYSAFKNCSNLKTLTLPISLNSVVKNSNPAFEGCTKIETIVLTGGTGFGHEYGDNTYTPWRISKSSHISLTMSDDVVSIGTNTFRNCAFLKEITLHEGLVAIHKSAFEGCNNLSVLNLPDSLKTIDAYSFSGCNKLENISFGTGLNLLHALAFGDMRFHDSEGNVLPLASGELRGCEFRGSSNHMTRV